jgi:hypothetical protein
MWAYFKRENQTVEELSGMISEISKIISVDFKDLVEIESLVEDWEVGEVRMIGEATNTLLLKEDGRVRIKTVIPPGAEFNKHFHNWNERCSIQEGKLRDRLFQKDRTWDRFNPYYVPRMIEHKPYNPSKEKSTAVIVDFTRD